MREEFPIDFSEVFLVNDSIRAFLTRERRKMNLVDVGMSFITFKPLLNELHFKGKKGPLLFENMFSREMEGKITLLSNNGGKSEIVDSTNFE